MTKHAKKTEPLQLVDRRKTATVRIPVPFLDVLASIEHSFFDLCIAAGRQVLDAMMEQDREALCGPRSRRDPDRRAGRAGTTTSEVTLGGRRIRIPRPRVRSTAGEELALPSYVFAAQRDPLDNHTLNAVACGISTRRYARSLEPLTEDLDERSTSKSAVSRRYVALSTQRMTAWLTTPLGDRHFPIVLIDGLILGDHTVLMALGIDTEGKKAGAGPARRHRREQPGGQGPAARPHRSGAGPGPRATVRRGRREGVADRHPQDLRSPGRDATVSDPQAPEHPGAPSRTPARAGAGGVDGGVVAGRRRARHPAAGAPSGLPGRCPSRRGGLRPRRARGDP